MVTYSILMLFLETMLSRYPSFLPQSKNTTSWLALCELALLFGLCVSVLSYDELRPALDVPAWLCTEKQV